MRSRLSTFDTVLYSNGKGWRIPLELFILAFYLYYWKNILVDWWYHWKHYKYMTPYHRNLRKNRIGYIMDIDFDEVINIFINICGNILYYIANNLQSHLLAFYVENNDFS